MHRVTVKTSTIFIAKRGQTQVYRSVGEIPAKLRKELEESTNSFNSATILIADRRGREEIVKALNGMPSTLRSRLANSLTPRPASERASDASVSKAVPIMHFMRRNWLEITLPAAVALIVWAAFNFR
jgi:topoisomerase IA-like protein